MHINSSKIYVNFKPICFAGDMIVFSRSSSLIFIDLKTEKIVKKISLPYPFSKKILARFKILRRLLRLDVICGLFAAGRVFVVFNFRIYSININNFSLVEEHLVNKGRGPIYLTYINSRDLKGFETGLYYGEYYGNMPKKPVHIIRRNDNGSYKTIYSFPKGQLNHIHNLIPDPDNNCVWILAGDFDDAASIWKAEKNFRKVTKVLSGSQQYRACIGFPVDKGLLYATDSQFEQNYIRLLRKVNETYISESFQKINGSVIYGCKVKDKIVFSTTSEPSKISNNKFRHWLETKPGVGIIKNESHIVLGNYDEGFKTIHSNRKDLLPYRLFQFGSIMFPSGGNPTNKLFSYSIANRKNDMNTEVRVIEIGS